MDKKFILLLLVIIILYAITVIQLFKEENHSDCAGKLLCKNNSSLSLVFSESFDEHSLTFKNNDYDSSSPRQQKLPPNQIKTILFWGAFNAYMGDRVLMRGNCPVKNCLFTPDVTLLDQSDIVVFSVETTPDFIVDRLPHQRFVFFIMESATTSKDIPILHDNRTRYNYFNWTMSYRRDSDVVLRDFLGGMVAKKPYNLPKDGNNYYHRYPPGTVKHIARRQLSFNEEPKLSSVETMEKEYKMKIALKTTLNVTDIDYKKPVPAWIKGKNKLVAWYVSHCDTYIQREEYARQLGKYIPVDIFGRCSNRWPCTKKCNDNEKLRNDYKFYLAFENTWCPDYVTEKFYHSLLLNVVPIVLGGSDYERFAPPHSYINAIDFATPKELADYLLLLNSSDSLYARYFDWKKHYEVVFPDLDGWCDLCRMANDESLPPKVYHDIKQWWLGDGQCENDRTKYF